MCDRSGCTTPVSRTVLHLRGVPLAVIANWLGHADGETTARIYAHSQDDALLLAGKTLGTVVTSSVTLRPEAALSLAELRTETPSDLQEI